VDIEESVPLAMGDIGVGSEGEGQVRIVSLSSELQPHVHNCSSLLQVSELRQKLQELDRHEDADMAALAAKYRRERHAIHAQIDAL
jgi:hypothetical protein